jgi:hypothetical protein
MAISNIIIIKKGEMRRPGRETLHMMCVVPDEKKKRKKIYISKLKDC